MEETETQSSNDLLESELRGRTLKGRSLVIVAYDSLTHFRINFNSQLERIDASIEAIQVLVVASSPSIAKHLFTIVTIQIRGSINIRCELLVDILNTLEPSTLHIPHVIVGSSDAILRVMSSPITRYSTLNKSIRVCLFHDADAMLTLDGGFGFLSMKKRLRPHTQVILSCSFSCKATREFMVYLLAKPVPKRLHHLTRLYDAVGYSSERTYYYQPVVMQFKYSGFILPPSIQQVIKMLTCDYADSALVEYYI